MAVKNCFIRGSVVRYVQLPAEHIDTQLLEDATRRGAFQSHPLVHASTYVVRNFRGNQSKQTIIMIIIMVLQKLYIIRDLLIWLGFFVATWEDASDLVK